MSRFLALNKMIDYHIHTTFSDGANSVEEVIDQAVRLGISELAITDHYDPFDPSWARKTCSSDELRNHFFNIRRCSENKPIKVYCGIETSSDLNGRLRVSPEILKMCDIVITSVHYFDFDGIDVKKGQYFNDAYWNVYKQKLLAMAAGVGHVLGHPEAYLPIRPMLEENTTFEDRLDICSRISEKYFDSEYIEQLGNALVSSGKAYELHGASGTPREWVVRTLHQKGVKFSIGSDAHALDRLGCNERAMHLWKDLGLSLIQIGCPLEYGNDEGE